MHLGIISDCAVYQSNTGGLYLPTPLKHQFDQWLSLSEKLTLCAPLYQSPPPDTHACFGPEKVHYLPVPPAGGKGLRVKLALLRTLPGWWSAIEILLKQVDLVHVRCPNNINILTLLALKRHKVPALTVYTGNWRGYPGEPLTYRLQRFWLTHLQGQPVLTYGQDPHSHCHPFFSPCFSKKEWREAATVIERKQEHLKQKRKLDRLNLVSVGRLDDNKSQITILQAMTQCREKGLNTHLTLIGEGPRRPHLETFCKQNNLAEHVHFAGTQSRASVLAALDLADISLLASRTEGFPKVVVEGLWRGAVPVVSDIGMNRYILEEGQRGKLFSFGDATALAAILEAFSKKPDTLTQCLLRGYAYAEHLTLDRFREELAQQMTRLLARGNGPIGDQL